MTENILLKMIQYFGTDTRRIKHALKVYGFASTIARSEQLAEDELFIVDIAAVLHDIGIKVAERKYNSSSGTYQEIEGPEVAKTLLSEFNLNNDILERICYIIGNHHTYTKIDGIDFQILVEADFLVNIYEDEIVQDAITSIRQKYFTTPTGISMLESMYMK